MDGDRRRREIRELMEREVKAPSASEAECRRFYDNNPARFQSDTIYEARHILLAAPPNDAAARATARKQAQQLIERLTRNPGEFAVLAAEYSACLRGRQEAISGSSRAARRCPSSRAHWRRRLLTLAALNKPAPAA